MNNFRNPYAMLAGRVGGYGRVGDVMAGLGGGGMMVPGAGPYNIPTGPTVMQPMNPYAPPGVVPGGPGPWGYGPGAYGPGACGWPPRGCYPNDICPPQSDGFYRQAMRSAVAVHEPQSALGLSSRDQSPNTEIGAGLPRTLSVSPSVPICLTQYIVSRTCAPFFGILSIRAARVEYLSDGQQVPAEQFTPDSLVRPTQLPQLYPGTQINVLVRNNDTADHHYDSSFQGISQPGCTPCI